MRTVDARAGDTHHNAADAKHTDVTSRRDEDDALLRTTDSF
jgi:hypothetical protein